MRKQKKAIERVIKSIRKKLEDNLSLDHVNYEIEYDGTRYDFSNGTTKEEKYKREQHIQAFARNILLKAIQGIIQDEFHREGDTYCYLGGEPPLFPAWNLIELICLQTPKAEDVASPIIASEIVELKETAKGAARAKALNLDSLYVNMQRENWTQEDQVKFIQEREKENVD